MVVRMLVTVELCDKTGGQSIRADTRDPAIANGRRHRANGYQALERNSRAYCGQERSTDDMFVDFPHI